MEENYVGIINKRKSPITRVLALLAIVLLLVILGVIAKQLLRKDQVKPQNVTLSLPKIVIVQITPDGFLPASLAINKDTIVEWISSDKAATHIIEANPYPSGSDLLGLKSEQLGVGATYRFKFTTTGTIGYHDRLNPATKGVIEVK